MDPSSYGSEAYDSSCFSSGGRLMMTTNPSRRRSTSLCITPWEAEASPMNRTSLPPLFCVVQRGRADSQKLQKV